MAASLSTVLTKESQKLLEDLLKYSLSAMFQISGSNARVGHRNRLNIFDVIKLASLLQISTSELKKYLQWSKTRSGLEFLENVFQTDVSCYKKEFKADLVFGVDVNETKKPGFDYFPPMPSSFTFKFTPVYGKREEEAVTILKRKTEEKLKVENNLFLAMRAKGSTTVANYDEI